ncbi:hypothetical protein [Polaromonas sp. C04]|uniref:hypothetical protein n=1 Tax=Polaromonas sp. C04 TaxID=1945857 RepID=UPI002570A97A|nr:hypothetical protein [Polaromonas sp. C04]
MVIPDVMKPMLGDRITVEVIRDAGHAMAPEQPRAMSEAIAASAHRLYLSPATTTGAMDSDREAEVRRLC